MNVKHLLDRLQELPPEYADKEISVDTFGDPDSAFLVIEHKEHIEYVCRLSLATENDPSCYVCHKEVPHDNKFYNEFCSQECYDSYCSEFEGGVP